jgi:hypothetical protein
MNQCKKHTLPLSASAGLSQPYPKQSKKQTFRLIPALIIRFYVRDPKPDRLAYRGSFGQIS